MHIIYHKVFNGSRIRTTKLHEKQPSKKPILSTNECANFCPYLFVDLNGNQKPYAWIKIAINKYCSLFISDRKPQLIFVMDPPLQLSAERLSSSLLAFFFSLEIAPRYEPTSSFIFSLRGLITISMKPFQ